MQKYGFVYIWYDRKHKRYYIGCHWGTEDDGYVCSSSNMKSAYKRRTNDFKRKILSRIYTDKTDLLEEEYKWLSKIKKQELGKKYYNLHNHHFKHWSSNSETYKSLSQKISEKTKESMIRPEVREKYLAGIKKRPPPTQEALEKRRQSMLGKNKIKTDKQLKAVRDAANKRKGIPLTEEHKNKIKNTTHFNELNNKKVMCKYCNFIGNIGNISRYHNDRCNKKERK